jgi:hypothetical protein
MPTLPASMYWYGHGASGPKPSGGFLEWKHSEKYAGCQRWMPKE